MSFFIIFHLIPSSIPRHIMGFPWVSHGFSHGKTSPWFSAAQGCLIATFTSPEQAAQAAQALDGMSLDKKHTWLGRWDGRMVENRDGLKDGTLSKDHPRLFGHQKLDGFTIKDMEITRNVGCKMDAGC